MKRNMLLIPMSACILAILPLPSDAYPIIRIVVSLFAAFVAYEKHQSEESGWILFLFLALLFNPIFPIYLYSKGPWVLVDLVAAYAFFVRYRDLDTASASELFGTNSAEFQMPRSSSRGTSQIDLFEKELTSIGTSKAPISRLKLRGFLENLDRLEKAKILALSAFVREKVLFENEELMRAIYSPSTTEPNRLRYFVSQLERMLSSAVVGFEQVEREYLHRGLSIQEFSRRHNELSNRALEVWICVLESGLSQSKLSYAREIWNMLMFSKPDLRHAIEQIKEVSAQMQNAEMEALYDSLSVDEWIKSCEFIPAELHMNSNK